MKKSVKKSRGVVRGAPRIFDGSFGVKLKQSTSQDYNHELNVEYFAIGQQYLDDDKFIFLERHSSPVMPTKATQRSHQFNGEHTVEMMNYDMYEQARGKKYKGYMVLVRDKRGEIIQHAASSNWLYENRERLFQIPVGRFFDKTCQRVHPTGPKRYYSVVTSHKSKLVN